MQMFTTFFLFVGANSWPHSILTNSYTGVLFFSNDTKRNCLYLTKGASFHSISRPDRDNFLCSWAKHSANTGPLCTQENINEYQHIVWEACCMLGGNLTME